VSLTGCSKSEGPATGPDAGTACDGSVQPCPLAKSLKGEVIEFTWGSGIKASTSAGKTPVPEPHWAVGVAVNDGAGSLRPGVHLIKGKGTESVTVKVKITENKNVSGSGKLEGKLGSIEFEGSCPTSVGEHSVATTLKNVPDSIQHLQGDVTWTLDVPDLGSKITLTNSTRLELFVVLDTPSSFYASGVWVEALRFDCDKIGLTGMKTNEDVASKVTTYLHGSHGLTYDTMSGAPSYGVSYNGGAFLLDSYLKAALTVVNCYDQAGGIQSLCGAVGVYLTWYYLEPFGYLKTSNLIGVGSCNNPFFKSNGSKALVAAADPKRTGFGNHAFGGLTDKVLDACAGPHTGTETKAQYVSASVDGTAALYKGWRPGTAADIATHSGVTSVA
jgi:hypothetical protein